MSDASGSLKTSSKESIARTAVMTGLVGVGITLTCVITSRSAIVLADFCNTVLEFLAVFISWLAIRRIERGAKHQFEYGTGKLESLTSLFVGAVMIACLLTIVGMAIKKFIAPAPVAGFGVWFNCTCQAIFGGINGSLFWRSLRVSREAPSPIASSQMRLFMTKVFSNGFVFLSLGISLALRNYHWSYYIDPVGSLVIAGSILLAAVGLLSSSFYDLLDRTLEEAHQVLILRELANYFDEYEAIHGIRSRRSGNQVFVEIYLEFDPDRIASEVHAAANRLKDSIQVAIPGSQVTIGLANEPVC